MRIIDRLMRAVVGAGLPRRSTALLETVGRRSGLPRVTPLPNGLDGDVFWIVTEHGHAADYVQNIKVNPQVRVHAGRGWQSGRARIVDEDPHERLKEIVRHNPRARVNSRIVRAVETEQLVVRVDLGEGSQSQFTNHETTGPTAPSAFDATRGSRVETDGGGGQIEVRRS